MMMTDAIHSHSVGHRWRAVLCAAALLSISQVAGAVTSEKPFQVTGTSVDPLFTEPYIDIDEWRDKPVRHRYVHGGFKNTEARFSIYFPPKEQYKGRFFQPLMAISGNENAAQTPTGQNIGFAIDSGGYCVESNLGKLDMFPGPDGTITGYRTSAAVAKYSKQLAEQMYGKHRTYGYLYGGSGGGFKTLSAMENTQGVWDGAVPYIHPMPLAMPNVFTAQAHAMRILKDKWPAIVDAIDPGGSGNMYAGLNTEEQEALREVTRMGFPPRAWFNHERIAFGYTGVYATWIDYLVKWDPTYWDEFWKLPGYLGAKPTESLLKARVQHATTIAKPIMPDEARAMGLPMTMAGGQNNNNTIPAALRMTSMPKGNVLGARLTIKSGAAAGYNFWVAGVVNDLVIVSFGEENSKALAAVKAGDQVDLDNSIYLAAQTYHRHQVPTPDFYVWDQFRDKAGKPIYPQRKEIIGPRFAEMGAGSVQTGEIKQKIIVVQTLMDEAAFPWMADWYRTKVKTALGPRFDDNYRLYFVDHAMHLPPAVMPGDPRPVISTRIVSYTNVLQQALRDLAAWAEKGTPPPASTEYKVVDGQVLVPAGAAERKGIQPVVAMKANGGARADVAVGQPVEFTGVIEAPPGTGKVIAAEWDFDGSGSYPVKETLADDKAKASVQVKATYTFTQPGTYFPALRGTSQREGDARTPFARVPNLDRVRVVVK